MGILGTAFGMIGMSAFINNLKNMVAGVDGSMDEAAQEIIDLGLDEIHKRLYPGHGYLTGALHDSYFGNYEKNGFGITSITIGTDLYYAPYVEFRWGNRLAHFYPAMEVVQEKMPEIFRGKINTVIGGSYGKF